MLRVNVSECHLAQRCPRLLAWQKAGHKQAWKVGLGGSGDTPGTLFHDAFAAPFHKAMASGTGPMADSFAKDVLQGPAKDLPRRIGAFFRDHLFVPYLQKHSATLTDKQTVALAGCLEAWGGALADFLAPLLRGQSEPSTLMQQVFHPPEQLLQAEYRFDDGESLTVSGRFDAVLLDSAAGEAVVVDFKGRRPTDLTEDFTQLVLYAWLLRESTGVMPRGIVLYLEADDGPAKFSANEIENGMRQLPQLFDVVRQVLEKREPLPCTVDSTLCGKCYYSKQCLRLKAADDSTTSAAMSPARHPDTSKETGRVADATPSPVAAEKSSVDAEEGEQALTRLCEILGRIGLDVRPHGVILGPRFMRLKIIPCLERGVTVNKLINRAVDLQVALALKAPPLIQAQQGFVSVDLPRSHREPLTLGALLNENTRTRPESDAAFPIGMTIAGQVFWVDLAEPTMTSILIGGTSGSGKSVLLQSIVVGLGLCAPAGSVRFVLVDPKRVTFTQYASLPCVEDPLYLDIGPALARLEKLVEEMEERYRLFEDAGVQDLRTYHHKSGARLARYVVMIDEYADMIIDKQTRSALETCIQRIGQKGRAAGFHLVLATQRPDAKVVNGVIKANLQLKIALKVTTATNSRIILDETGAEFLVGHGDMLVGGSTAIERLQGPMVTKSDVDRLIGKSTSTRS